MTTLDILGFILLIFFGLVAWLLFCIAKWGAPKTSKRQAEELAEQAEALKARQIAKEDQWLADIEHAIPILQDELKKLQAGERTLDNIRDKTRIYVALMNAEKARMTLKQRRAFGSQTAATVFEGRM